MLTPVTLPPGRAKLRITPAATILGDKKPTTGTVWVASFAASVAASPTQKITSGFDWLRPCVFRILILPKIKATGNNV